MTLDHIALIVSKEENLIFYKNLGFVEKKRIERGYDSVVFLECDGVVLEIFVDGNHPERVNETRGLRHIALTVESLDGFEDIKTDWFGRRFVFVEDPDGQVVELVEKERG